MPNPYAYFDAIVANRAMLLSDQDSLEGQTLVSLETQDMEEDSLLSYCEEHFADFIKMIRILDSGQQAMLLSYYVTHKTQNNLALVFQSTQTVCSFHLRMMVKVVCAHLAWGGPPSVELMHGVLKDTEFEDRLKVPLSVLIQEFASGRSFNQIADKYDIHRPDIRRTMSQASKHLLNSDAYMAQGELLKLRTPDQIALGAYIHNLIDKANPTGPGKSKRERAEHSRCLVLKDPPLLGEFRIDVTHPDFGAVFMSSANL